MKRETCVFCEKTIFGYVNNPEPLKDEGSCCDVCNLTLVIPARIAILNGKF